MMPSLVLDMQKLALSHDKPVESLVRHALTAATKLGDQEIRSWASRELNGYRDTKEIPEYRVILGSVRAWNPYNGIWIPVDIPNEEIMMMMKSVHLAHPIGEISRLSTTEGTIQLELDDMFTRLFRESPQYQAGIVPRQLIGQTSLHGILEIVRTRVLEWSLALEEKNILGEGLTFTTEEKKAAAQMVFNISDSSQVSISTGEGSSSVRTGA